MTTVAQLSEKLEDGLAVDVFTLTTNAVPEEDATFHWSPSMTTLQMKNSRTKFKYGALNITIGNEFLTKFTANLKDTSLIYLTIE